MIFLSNEIRSISFGLDKQCNGESLLSVLNAVQSEFMVNIEIFYLKNNNNKNAGLALRLIFVYINVHKLIAQKHQ